MPPYEFAEVIVSDPVHEKLGSKHGLTVDDVAEAMASHDLVTRWQENEDGVKALVCFGSNEKGRALVIVVYPVGGSRRTWRLATAYPDPRR